jgi:hypothetical protein
MSACMPGSQAGGGHCHPVLLVPVLFELHLILPRHQIWLEK